MTLLHLTRDYCVSTDGWATAPGSFLFSLRNNDDLHPFKSVVRNGNEHSAIFRRSTYGPTFGSKDLSILLKNGKSKTDFGYIYQLPTGYNYLDSKTKSLLAGNYEFTPKEVEVLNLI